MRPGVDRLGTLVLTSSVLLAVAAGPATVRAHFILVAPDSWMSQGIYGDPQKLGPCGEEGGGTPTGAVTAFRPGDTIEVTIDETIYHPGHYRVALAINDRSELPPPPPVTAVDSDPCGSTEIQDPPIFPVLADNILPHTERFDGPQTFTVTLPADVTCARCTLQVIEYMSSHGRPCFYHHCADISIQVEVATPTATAAPTDTPVSAATATAVEPTTTATPIHSVTCAGDCDGSGNVMINELVMMITIALDQAPIGACQAGDGDHSLAITVNEILAAVNRALSGC